MLKRLLLAVALPVLAAAPVHAQTTFVASGGNIIFTPTGYGTNVIVGGVPVYSPFDLFADYLGLHRRIAFTDGTLFTLDTRGSVAISSLGSLGSLDLGFFGAGASIVFTYAIHGQSYNTDDFYRQRVGNVFDLDYADINNNSSDRFRFSVSGISSATGLVCPGAIVGPPAVTCSLLDTPVTSTPEPGTIALFATGLAGLIPVAIRRRRAS